MVSLASATVWVLEPFFLQISAEENERVRTCHLPHKIKETVTCPAVLQGSVCVPVVRSS